MARDGATTVGPGGCPETVGPGSYDHARGCLPSRADTRPRPIDRALYPGTVNGTPTIVRHAGRRSLFRVVAPLGLVSVLVMGGALPATAAGAPTRTVPAPSPVPASPAVPTGPRPLPGGAAALPTGPIDPSACPWLEAAMAAHEAPEALADLVVARMTLPEKLGELVLTSAGPYENVDAGVGRLCIPSLTLQDGPSGLAFDDTGVTLLPSPLGMAATFDPALSFGYGQVVGSEARAQGIDVSQGPDLNIDRIPESGRASESYGEDPLLTSEMGVADIEGIQSQGVMAEAKHLVAYQQETDRGALDAQVSSRALEEIYLPPFRAAVTQADVAGLMCAYPRLNGTFQCQDPALGQILAQWGFAGFVRSDLGAVHDQPAALGSGVELLKPASVGALADDVADGTLSTSTVDADVERVLTQMFTYGLIGRPAAGDPGTPVDTPAHAAFALTAAERSAVLLKNQGGLLPLDPTRLRSVAVIGADASTDPVIQGYGSARVTPPFVSTPLAALQARLGPGVTVRYAAVRRPPGISPSCPPTT